jgi:hypothetical protein
MEKRYCLRRTGTRGYALLIGFLAAGVAGPGAAGTGTAMDGVEVASVPGTWSAPPYWLPLPAGSDRDAERATFAPKPGGNASEPLAGPVALPFFAINPCRLADTRPAGGFPAPFGPPYMPPAVLRDFPIAGQCGIPSSARAVSFNFAVTNTLGPGFLLVFPAGNPVPPVSTLTYLAGQTVSNAAIVPLGAGGAISAAPGVSGFDLIIDVNGYYAPSGIVASLSGLTGDVTLSAGANVTITPSGNTLTVAAPLTSLNASNVTSGVLGISFGGTGSTSAAGARLALGAAASGVNADITSLTGLTTPLALAKGGTGATTAAGARTAMGAAAGGANADIRSLSGLTTPLSVAQGGTGSSTSLGSVYQARVVGTCATGSFVVSVANDGTVGCGSPTVDPRPGFTISNVDNASSVLSWASITIGTDGLGLISYFDQSGLLKSAHCKGLACTSVSTAVLDASGYGGPTSIVIGADGLGLISYTLASGRLKVAHCNDVACTSATTATLIDSQTVGGFPSVTIGADGLGVLAYVDQFSLAVARCRDIICSGLLPPTFLDSSAGNAWTAITVGSDGLPLISYTDLGTQGLKVAHCNDSMCLSATTTLLSGSESAEDISIAVGADGLGLISYFGNPSGALKVAHCNNAACTGATVTTLYVSGSHGTSSSITTGTDGLGLVAFTGVRTGVLHCNNAACSSASTAILEQSSGYHASITIGTDGQGLIAYFDGNSSDLKTAHCANPFCTPYVRRR